MTLFLHSLSFELAHARPRLLSIDRSPPDRPGTLHPCLLRFSLPLRAAFFPADTCLFVISQCGNQIGASFPPSQACNELLAALSFGAWLAEARAEDPALTGFACLLPRSLVSRC